MVRNLNETTIIIPALDSALDLVIIDRTVDEWNAQLHSDFCSSTETENENSSQLVTGHHHVQISFILIHSFSIPQTAVVYIWDWRGGRWRCARPIIIIAAAFINCIQQWFANQRIYIRRLTTQQPKQLRQRICRRTRWLTREAQYERIGQ